MFFQMSRHDCNIGVVVCARCNLSLSACMDSFVTLLLTKSYLPGALTLGHTLRSHGTNKAMSILVCADQINTDIQEQLNVPTESVK